MIAAEENLKRLEVRIQEVFEELEGLLTLYIEFKRLFALTGELKERRN